MNGSQQLLVMGAILLFSLLTINANRTIRTATELTLDAEHIITATSIGEELIAEVSARSFDEATVGNAIIQTWEMTSPQSLGPESGEIYPNYDDVDDFNFFTTSVNTPRLGAFTASVQVEYVDPLYPEDEVTSKTTMKRITVQVEGQSLSHPVVLHYYSCY